MEFDVHYRNLSVFCRIRVHQRELFDKERIPYMYRTCILLFVEYIRQNTGIYYDFFVLLVKISELYLHFSIFERILRTFLNF